MFARLVGFCMFVTACGGGTPGAETPSGEAVRADESPPRPPGTLYRGEVVATVNDGFGRFLQLVEVEPSFVDGKFVGFQVLALEPQEFWSGVDLRRADVITKVNGKPIERPNQAHEVFESLRTADELVVNLVRAGKPRTLRYRIVEDGTPPARDAG